ncbi:MAG: APC family permease [Gammaproteobacteria bacterium]
MTAGTGGSGRTAALKRELGPFGAVMMGLGAMLGTGVFVSIGLGAGLAGPAVILALAIAAVVALCNGLSSAQLAAAYPVSGGTYEYGYRLLGPRAGFTAGWVFLIAKSTSAATAALGFAGYLLHALGLDPRHAVPVALGAIAALTAVVLAGIRRSNAANIAIVSVTVLALLFFVGAGLPAVDVANFSPFVGGASERGPVARFLEATALMFVAYTGYARIATLGEEVRQPERTIPRAIVASALIAMASYVLVALVAVGVAGGDELLAATERQAAPLAVAAKRFTAPYADHVLVVGAIAAMLSVLLNLLLGLSRVVLAMARRGDVPEFLGRLNAARTTPTWAVLAVALLIAGIAATGDVRVTWSFSAFAVLIYYALTHLAALRLAPAERRYPRAVARLGLAGCLGLAFFVDPRIWLTGLVLLAAGLLWHAAAARLRG